MSTFELSQETTNIRKKDELLSEISEKRQTKDCKYQLLKLKIIFK